MGFTLNNITMLGLILAIGIVIDDAVVVHENIFRHMEEGGLDAMSGRPPRHARNRAGRAGDEPVARGDLRARGLHGGLVGRFFRSFGLTVAFAVLMSLFVSFTLTPMLCAHFLKLDPDEAGQGQSKSGWIYRLIDGSLRPPAAAGRCGTLDRRGRRLPACRRLDRAAGDEPGGQPGAARRSERIPGLDPHARRLHARADRPGGAGDRRAARRSCRASCSGSPRSARRRAAARGT